VLPLLRRLWRSPWRAALVAAVGAGAGGAYAHFIGCRTGTCLITSSVWTASLYGAAIGALAGWPSRDRRAQAAEAADAEERG